MWQLSDSIFLRVVLHVDGCLNKKRKWPLRNRAHCFTKDHYNNTGMSASSALMELMSICLVSSQVCNHWQYLWMRRSLPPRERRPTTEVHPVPRLFDDFCLYIDEFVRFFSVHHSAPDAFLICAIGAGSRQFACGM
jgi:hypothetical protein